MRSYSSYPRQYYRASTINITNVTNVTNVTVHGRPSYGEHGRHKHAGGRGLKNHDRPPSLVRFCGTCGLLDYDKAARMDDGQMLDESAKVVAYGCRGLARSTGNIASHLGGAAKCLCGAFVAIGDAIFGK